MMAFGNENSVTDKIKVNQAASTVNTIGGNVGQTPAVNIPINVDIEKLKMMNINPDVFFRMPPAEQQKIINKINNTDINMSVKGLYVETTQNPKNTSNPVKTESESNNHNEHTHDETDHPLIPTRADWKKMSYDDRVKYIINEIDYHMDKENIPKDKETRKELFLQYADEQIRNKKGIKPEEWALIPEAKKQKWREKEALSFEMVIKNGYTEEDVAQMNRYNKLIEESKIIEEKIKNGIKINKTEIDQYNKAQIASVAHEVVNNAEEKYKDNNYNFMDDFNQTYSTQLEKLKDLKKTNPENYYQQKMDLMAQFLLEKFENAPANEKDSVLCGVDVKNHPTLVIEIIMSSKIPEAKRDEMLNAWGVNVDRTVFNATVNAGVEAVKRGDTSASVGIGLAKVTKFRANAGVDGVKAATRTLTDDYAIYGSQGYQVAEILIDSESNEISTRAAEQTHTLQTQEQKNEVSSHINGIGGPKSQTLALASIRGASYADKMEDVFRAQEIFNDGSNEYTMKGMNDATEILDPKYQNKFDENNFNAMEALDDEEMAKRLHQYRIDQMPNWDVNVQAEAYKRTMESKFDEIQEYAASNIYKLDESVRDYASEITRNLGKENVTNSIRTEAPPTDSASSKSSTSENTAQSSAQAVNNYSVPQAKPANNSENYNNLSEKAKDTYEEIDLYNGNMPREQAVKFFNKLSRKEQNDLLKTLSSQQFDKLPVTVCETFPELIPTFVDRGKGIQIITSCSSSTADSAIRSMKAGSNKIKKELNEFIVNNPARFTKISQEQAKQSLDLDKNDDKKDKQIKEFNILS